MSNNFNEDWTNTLMNVNKNLTNTLMNANKDLTKTWPSPLMTSVYRKRGLTLQKQGLTSCASQLDVAASDGLLPETCT